MSSKYRGIIGYLQLDNFWDSLTFKERKTISRYSLGRDFSNEKIDMIKGEIITCTETQLHFLYPFIGWAVNEKRWELADKIITFCDSLEDTIISKHFFYMNAANCYYLQRKTRVDAEEKAILFCQKDIDISKQVKIAFQDELINLAIKFNKEPFLKPPYYPSFKQLCIIYEQKDQIEKALEICNRAIALGFVDDKTKSGMMGRKIKLEKKLICQNNG